MLITFKYRLYPSQNQKRLLEQTVETCRQSGEEIALDVGAGIGQRAEPGQMGVPVAASNAGESAAASKVKQVLPEAATVEVQ